MASEPPTPAAEEIVLYAKDTKTKIATITLNRPDRLNAPTIAARHRFADLIHRSNVDDEVKVLVIRGAGDHFGSGADLPEMSDMFNDDPNATPLRDFRIGPNEGVKYPPKGSYRHLAQITSLYANSSIGLRNLQDFKKISIVEAKGYCYGWHFYLAADADLLISSEETLFGHAAWRYVGWAPRMWQWAVMMGLRKFQEMLFTGRPFTAQEMQDCGFVNSVVPRDQLEAEVEKYALACANTRPTDTVVMQKTFFEVFKQQQGEYMGSILSAWLESMLPLVKSDGELDLAEAFEKGLATAVKSNDALYPPEWRLSYQGRRESAGAGGNIGALGSARLVDLNAQIEALQRRVIALEQKLEDR